MNGHASLNRIYRLVWSDVRQSWVVAPETARGRTKRNATVGTSAAPSGERTALHGLLGLLLVLLGLVEFVAGVGGLLASGGIGDQLLGGILEHLHVYRPEPSTGAVFGREHAW